MGLVLNINSANLKTKKDYALAYAAIGWHVLPIWWIVKKADGQFACGCGKPDCKNPGKHPWTKGGQNDATTQPEQIKRWWDQHQNLNIGIFLAPSNLVAVDIDPRNGGHETIEMLEDQHGQLYSDVTAFTGGGGEHRIFTLPQGLQNLPGKLGAGVDLKLNGFIVVEPSSHVSGKSYEWEASSNPLEGESASPLPDWIRDLSISRKQDSIESSSTFISRYVTDSQINDLRSALLHIDADDRDTWIRVGSALKTIGAVGWNLFVEYSQRSEKFDFTDLRRVWASFKPHSISYESVFHLAKVAGWENMPSTVTPMADISLFLKQTAVVLPTELPRLPGILGDIEDYYNATAAIPQPLFAQQAAIGILSVLLGRRVKTSYDDYSSLYLACIAPTACGKEHVKTITGDILKACSKEQLIAGDGYTSAGGVISALKEKPVHISIIDELGLYLEAANNKSNTNGREANTMLMECIGRLKREVRSKNYSTKAAKSSVTMTDTILHPAITINAMTTPSTFYKNLTIDMVKDGFFGRFITVQSKSPRVPPRRVKPLPVPQSVVDWSSAIDDRISDTANLFANPAVIAEQCVIDVSDEAITALDAFSAEMVELMNTLEAESLDGLAGRSGEMAGRLALIFAMARDSGCQVVNQADAELAASYIRRCTGDIVSDVRDNLAGSDYQKAKQEILSAIRANAKGFTERDMHRLAPFSKFKDKELAEILKALTTAGYIALTNTREGKPGKPRLAFVAITSNEVDLSYMS